MERRRHVRTQLSMTLHAIRLDPDGGDMHDTLTMVDISRGGVGVRSSRAFYRGQRVVLCLPLRQDGGRRNVTASVVRCQGGKDGFGVGLEFDYITAGQSVHCDGFAMAAAAA
jgi:hypothetical protein